MYTENKILLKNIWRDIKAQPLLWGSITALMVMTQTTQDRIAFLFNALPGLEATMINWLLNIAVPIKTLLFAGLFVILVTPLIKEFSINIDKEKRNEWLKSAGVTILTLMVLAALSLVLENKTGGIDFAEISYSPFAQTKSWQSRRLLMPFLAHIFFLRGQTLYFLFFVLLTGLLIFMLHRWLEMHAPLPAWQFISLCTSSFIFYQFQLPGHVDVLVFIFFILSLQTKSSDQVRLIWLVLALLTHEASIFVGISIAWFTFDKKTRLQYIIVIGIYLASWVAAYLFRIDDLLISHNVGGMSGFKWLLQYPGRELLGIFMAFKLLWWIPISALILMVRERNFQNAKFLFGIILGGFILTIIGVDSSRLMGFSFPALLIGLQILQPKLNVQGNRRLISRLFALNILVPSLYVGLNTGILLWPGIYKWMFTLLRSLFWQL